MDNGARSYRRFLDGDRSAFDAIMDELFFGVVFFANRYVRDVHAAEDIAMDTFVELIVHPHRYNFKVSLKTYLYTIARSRAIDYIRRRRFVSLDEEAETADLRTLEEKFFSDERRRDVNAAVEKLPEKMRAAVHLVYFDEMTYDEAARVLGMKYKQIDNLLYRARRDLKEILGEVKK